MDQYGNCVTPNILQPYTMYLVMKQITWGVANVLNDDGINLQIGSLYQIGATPRIAFSDIIDVISTTNLILNTWGIVTIIVNGVNSILRINLLNAAIGDLNANKNGITLGCDVLGTITAFSNCEYAYIIMRNVADSTAVQNNFINWLKNRFAI